ncbi:MAG: hypothetical protein NZM09_02195 [Ignavibacterium sp.]|nr:hypothetical protein [Ignavibacterium sp.]MDW8374487.1 hypothetical protein [Ignavibacteriales bacterium]
MGKIKIRYVYIFLILIIFLIVGCREDIIEPDNPAGNKNSPFRTEKENYFDVAINAEGLTTEMIFDTYFNSESNFITVYVNNRQNGLLQINIFSKENKLLFTNRIEIGEVNIRQRISRGIPAKLKLSFDNFTGKIRIVLSRSS